MAMSLQEWMQQLAQGPSANLAGTDLETLGPLYQQYLANPDTWQAPREATQADVDALRAQWGDWAPTVANLQAQGFKDIQRDDTRLTPTNTSIFTGINPETGQRESIGQQGRVDEETSRRRFNTAVLSILAAGGPALIGASGTAAGLGGAAATAESNPSAGTTGLGTNAAVANDGGLAPGSLANYEAAVDSTYGAPVFPQGTEPSWVPQVTAATTVGGAAATPALSNSGGSPSGNSVDNPSPTSGSNMGNGVAGGTALSRILDGSATAADWLSIGGNVAGAGLGYLAADRQSSRLDALARDYMNLGAPSRARFEASFDPNFDIAKQTGVQQAIDTSTETLLRKLSTQGNPYGNPGGLAELQKYIVGNVALPQLNEYRRQNLGAGGLAQLTAAAPGAAMGGINADAGRYDAIGGALADITNPRRNIYDYLRDMRSLG